MLINTPAERKHFDVASAELFPLLNMKISALL